MNKLLVLAERNVPRYTSYPTAPHFTPAIDAEAYAGWLAALPRAATLSLYLHVPFCHALCLYCGCHTKATRRPEPVERYAQRLMTEIDLVAAAIGASETAHRVLHLHWGGGTPSILGMRRIEEITAKLAHAFDLSGISEHAIELDPRHVSPPLARGLKQIGVNRVSLGVQDFAPHVQQAIGRIQPAAQVELAVGLLRAAGIERINMDLMYGLPRQSIADVVASAERAAAFRPQRLALFGYAHVPWFRTQQRLIDEATLPGPEARITQAQAACDVLRAHGYVAIGLDHFALPEDALAVAQGRGQLHRNFQGYTTDACDALIGFGASAISRLPQGFVQNHVDLATYSRAIEAGRLAAAKGKALTAEDLLRGRIIERLMCDMGVDLGTFAQKAAPFASEVAALQGLATEGLVRIDEKTITVTDKGRPFIRLIVAVFDAYLPQNDARHSVAV
jgi:oxygen-independent coproporphyrinogen-3 oxidase